MVKITPILVHFTDRAYLGCAANIRCTVFTLLFIVAIILHDCPYRVYT